MTWFRSRLGGAAADPRTADHRTSEQRAAAEANDDDPATLRATMFKLNRYINQNSGRLPGESVVIARRVTDGIREVLDTTEVRPLDIHTLVSVKGILNDYLPTTLGQFLALDPEQHEVLRPSGRTPVLSLIEQLEDLLEASAGLLEATRTQDADALLAQGSFLRTKFSRSDLDL